MREALSMLEIVASFSVGLDKVDLRKCKEKGIRVINTSDVLTDDVADLAILRSGSWKSIGEYRLCSKFSERAVGIVRLGRIGLAIAKRAEAFGCTVSFHSITPKPQTNYKHYSNIIELATNSQVLIVSCSLTDHYIVTRDVIDALGSHGVLVKLDGGPLWMSLSVYQH